MKLLFQFSDSRNNDVRNGLALSKNAHWLFDQGLWTIADDYTCDRRYRAVYGTKS